MVAYEGVKNGSYSTKETEKWRRLRGNREIEKMINGVKFKDGEEVKEAQKVA